MLRRVAARLCAAVGASSASTRRAELTFPSLHGFELKGVHRVDDLNLVAYEMVHSATAAPYYHIDVEDSNNTFCIGFRTPAENNKGTSHVLEHTTLCGSKKYPVRDPFFAMLKRSLSTYMNALTGSDFTLYPFSTTNKQDYANLLDIYLDAVFHPLLRLEDFHQEGHRVETAEAGAAGAGESAEPTTPPLGTTATDADTYNKSTMKEGPAPRLAHNGVVYNEMRGVVSEPDQHFTRCLMKEMLPQTHYTYVSGGYPPDILNLTYDELVSFHARHYHPSNSITFTYGDRHPQEHMQTLDKYFSGFSRSTPVVVPTLPESCRFAQPKVVELVGPIDAMGNAERQKRVAVSFGVPQAQNTLEDMVSLNVLDTLLASGPSSPMYKALIESQIGSKFTSMQGYAYYLSSPIITYGVSGVDQTRSGTEKEVLEAVDGALRSVQANGFDPRRVRSVIFQEELQQRHRAADYGLNLCTGLSIMGLCRCTNTPLDSINWLPHLRKLEANNAASLLPRIDSVLLQNPHRAVVSVSANKDFLNRLRGQLKKADDDLNTAATPADVARVEAETAEWRARVRAPQNMDVLPTLTVVDIPVASFAEPVPQQSAKDAHTYTIPFATNGLVYVHGLIPFSHDLAECLVSGEVAALSPNLPLVWPLMGQTGAGGLSFKDLSIETELVCSGFSFSPLLNESYLAKGTSISGTSFGFYTTKEKLTEALHLLSLALLEPRLSASDPDVHACVLSHSKMTCSTTIQSLQHQGNHIAMMRAVAQLTRRGAIREHWHGISHSRHASALLGQLQGTEAESRAAVEGLLAEYAANMEAIAHSLRSATVWATCEPTHQPAVEQALLEFRARFPTQGSATSPTPQSTHLALSPLARRGAHEDGGGQPLRVTERLPIDASFVGYAVPNALTWTHPDQAAVRVACLLLSNEYLHRRVREEGGAYGSGSLATLQGEVGGVTMSSYRDPAPAHTMCAFAEAGEWLADSANVTEGRLAEAKLRLFSEIDYPYAADSFGEAHFFNDVRQDMKQVMRDALLGVCTADVVRVAQYFQPSAEAVVSVLEPSQSTAEA